MTDTSGADTALAAITSWFKRAARPLPWRSQPANPWGVLVSEVMLQQTPVSRVLPIYEQWMQRWPQPHDLADAAAGEAVRLWGRLGYPRRALRLHAAAGECVTRFDGTVPSDVADLRSLPGVGEYTAAAVASFAYGQRHAVLDTNVRRVHARWLDGTEHPVSASPTSAERQRALDLLPTAPARASLASVAVMELGALICTARAPTCSDCPIATNCAWRQTGYPPWSGPPRGGQAWSGTDRQCRGALMATLRDAAGAVDATTITKAWDVDEQRDRALASLIEDGLIVRDGAKYRLP